MKFDISITNPPYNTNLDIKILNALHNHIDEIICIHPCIPYDDIKHSRKMNIDYKKNFNFVSLEYFNMNKVFGTNMMSLGVISHMKVNHVNNHIEVDYFGDKYISNNILDVTKFASNWVPIVKPFYNKIKEISKLDNIMHHSKTIENIENTVQVSICSGNDHHSKEIRGNNIVQLAMIRGHEEKVEQLSMCRCATFVSKDFYTLVMRGDKNLGIRSIKPYKVYYKFNTQIEALNFLNYLKTDFARFCLAIYKTNANLLSGNISRLIPWLDFTQEWNDKKLFRHFEIDQTTQEYIRKFLPDYYGIRS